MKIRYKHQRFQAEATKCVSDVFQGQPKHDGSRTFLNKIDMWDFDGFGNLPLVLDNESPLRVLFRDACFKDDAQKSISTSNSSKPWIGPTMKLSRISE